MRERETEEISGSPTEEPPWIWGIEKDGCWTIDHDRGVHSRPVAGSVGP